MTKQDIVRRVACEAYIEMAPAGRVVQRVLDSITESLATGRGIELRGVGVFDVVMAKGRKVVMAEGAGAVRDGEENGARVNAARDRSSNPETVGQ